jgi:hypothetical protein
MNQILPSEFNIYIPDNGTLSNSSSDLVTEDFDLYQILHKMEK